MSPEVAKHTRHETWEGLTGDYTIAGVGGAGKSTAMRAIRAKLEAEGRKTYVVSFQNSVAAANNGLTLHMFCAAMAAGSIQTPCTVLWDEVFYCPISALARMVKYFRLPEIQWIFVGDWHQPQMEANRTPPLIPRMSWSQT